MHTDRHDPTMCPVCAKYTYELKTGTMHFYFKNLLQECFSELLQPSHNASLAQWQTYTCIGGTPVFTHICHGFTQPFSPPSMSAISSTWNETQGSPATWMDAWGLVTPDWRTQVVLLDPGSQSSWAQPVPVWAADCLTHRPTHHSPVPLISSVRKFNIPKIQASLYLINQTIYLSIVESLSGIPQFTDVKSVTSLLHFLHLRSPHAVYTPMLLQT
jgi:hypothetical protein